MRKHSPITSLIALLTLVLSGCHQTSATMGAPALSPVGAGQAPMLNPFGGATKVSPPPTGSYSTPNGYMGTPIPGGPMTPGPMTPGNMTPGQISPMPNGSFPVQSNNAIGSGLQPGGWNSSNPTATQTAPNSFGLANSAVAPVSTFGVESASDPRAGGMQAIDLTSAPAPPGYRPANASPSISVPQPQAPVGGWGSQPSQSIQAPSYPTPTYPTPSYPPSAYPNTNLQNVSSPYPTDPSAELASRLTPLPPSNNAIPMNQPAVQSAGTQSFGPSTEPINPAGGGDPNLMWRTPGTQF